MGYAGGGINGTLRWRDLALDELLPVDEEREEALRAIQARKMASGTPGHNPQPQAQAQAQADQTMDEDEDEDDEDEDDDGDDDDDEDDEDEDEDEDEEEEEEIEDDLNAEDE